MELLPGQSETRKGQLPGQSSDDLGLSLDLNYREVVGGGSPSFDEIILMGDPAAVIMEESTSNPAAPADGVEVKFYMKGSKIVFQYNDGGTVRYYTLDLTSALGLWVHSTVAP